MYSKNELFPFFKCKDTNYFLILQLDIVLNNIKKEKFQSESLKLSLRHFAGVI